MDIVYGSKVIFISALLMLMVSICLIVSKLYSSGIALGIIALAYGVLSTITVPVSENSLDDNDSSVSVTALYNGYSMRKRKHKIRNK